MIRENLAFLLYDIHRRALRLVERSDDPVNLGGVVRRDAGRQRR